jgi:hypothetical protein
MIIDGVYPEQKTEILRGVYPETKNEILRFAQDDRGRRAQGERRLRAQDDQCETQHGSFRLFADSSSLRKKLVKSIN